MSNQQGIGTSPVELLAPAGGAEALHAAVAGGADAVYLGLDAFNARRNADNFTLETLGEACDYAHLRGVRVYVTLNTAILPSEVDRALECARQAYRAGADASSCRTWAWPPSSPGRFPRRACISPRR